MAKHGDKPFSMLDRAGVVILRDELDGEPANKRVKCLRYLFNWAIEADLASENPAREVKLLVTGSAGYVPWTPEDVLQFEARHPIGTKARLAFALFLYTGQRKSDVVQWGPMNARGDRLIYVQHKGKSRKVKRRNIPLVEPLRQILDASPLGDKTWLETEHGQPFSIAGFGNKFRQWSDDAGLHGLSSHGIRKAVGIMAAERGCTAHQIMEILGHDSLDEAERYTRQANAQKLGDEGFRRVWGTEQVLKLSYPSRICVPPFRNALKKLKKQKYRK